MAVSVWTTFGGGELFRRSPRAPPAIARPFRHTSAGALRGALLADSCCRPVRADSQADPAPPYPQHHGHDRADEPDDPNRALRLDFAPQEPHVVDGAIPRGRCRFSKGHRLALPVSMGSERFTTSPSFQIPAVRQADDSVLGVPAPTVEPVVGVASRGVGGTPPAA